MGHRFVLETKDNCEGFCESEREILRGHTRFWEPTLEIKLVGDNQIIIEPMDQRRNSRYHMHIEGLLGRVYKRFDYFSLKRDDGFYPNPPLHPLFFSYVILKDALERAKNRGEYTLVPSPTTLCKMEKTPLSDDFLHDMLNNGFCINYAERLEAGRGYCYPSPDFIPHDYICALTEELYEFGFAQTIRRAAPYSS